MSCASWSTVFFVRLFDQLYVCVCVFMSVVQCVPGCACAHLTYCLRVYLCVRFNQCVTGCACVRLAKLVVYAFVRAVQCVSTGCVCVRVRFAKLVVYVFVRAVQCVTTGCACVQNGCLCMYLCMRSNV